MPVGDGETAVVATEQLRTGNSVVGLVVALFVEGLANSGKRRARKELGLLAMTCSNVHTARIALGANDAYTVKVRAEAEACAGPSPVIDYAHCMVHGNDPAYGLAYQKQAVARVCWLLHRCDPNRGERGKSWLTLDARPSTLAVAKFLATEDRTTTMRCASTSTTATLRVGELTLTGRTTSVGNR